LDSPPPSGFAALSRTNETLVEMTNGCICCTLRDDLLQEVARLARDGRFDDLLVESTGVVEPLPVAATFTFEDEAGYSLSQLARLDTMVSVHELDRLEAVLRTLNPDATIVRPTMGRVPLDVIFDTGLFDFEKAEASPGWQKELAGQHVPETEESGISSFVWRAERPFHPARLVRAIQRGMAGVIRSKGICWLATRPDVIGLWSLAGKSMQLNPAGYWRGRDDDGDAPLFPKQELVFIGAGMDRVRLERMLDAAVLTDAELAQDEVAWRRFKDPLPDWPVEALDPSAVRQPHDDGSRGTPAQTRCP
jgi:G3E family GTPase